MASRKTPRIDEPLSPTKSVVRTVRLPAETLEAAQRAADALTHGNRTAFIETAILELCARLGVGSPDGKPLPFHRVPARDEILSGDFAAYSEELLALEATLVDRLKSDRWYLLEEERLTELVHAASQLVDIVLKTPSEGAAE